MKSGFFVDWRIVRGVWRVLAGYVGPVFSVGTIWLREIVVKRMGNWREICRLLFWVVGKTGLADAADGARWSGHFHMRLCEVFVAVWFHRVCVCMRVYVCVRSICPGVCVMHCMT